MNFFYIYILYCYFSTWCTETQNLLTYLLQQQIVVLGRVIIKQTNFKKYNGQNNYILMYFHAAWYIFSVNAKGTDILLDG